MSFSFFGVRQLAAAFAHRRSSFQTTQWSLCGKIRSWEGHDFTGCGRITIRCHPGRSEGSAFRKMPRKKQIPHSADAVRNDKRRAFSVPQTCPAIGFTAEGFGSWFSHRLHCGVPVRTSQKRCQPTALHNNHVWGKNQRYLRAKRSKSAICEAISSRAASAAERIP